MHLKIERKYIQLDYFVFIILRIWFDILTPKQIMFFQNFVEILRKDNHDILCTGRDYREAKELAKLKKIDIKTIGKHGGDNKYEKLNAST